MIFPIFVGLMVPLLTNAHGHKFGKSVKSSGSSDAIWLMDNKLSSYKFYQKILNLSDDFMTEGIYRQLTFYSIEEIQCLFKQSQVIHYIYFIFIINRLLR